MKNNFLLRLDEFGIRKVYQVIQDGRTESKQDKCSINELRGRSMREGTLLYLWIDIEPKETKTSFSRTYRARITELDQNLVFLAEAKNRYLFSQAIAISNHVIEEKIQEIMLDILERANARPLFEPIFRKIEDFDQYNNYSIFPQLFAGLYLKSLFNFASANYSYLSTDKILWNSLELFPMARTDANYFVFEIADIPHVFDADDCDVMVQVRVIPQEDMKSVDKRGKLSTPFLVTFRVITGTWLKKNISNNDLFFTQRTLLVNNLNREVIQEHIDYLRILFTTCTDRVDALATLSICFNLPEHALRLFYEWEVNL